MNIAKATVIFLNLDSEQFTDEEKAMAIYEIMNMPTHNSINKVSIIEALKWLWNKAYELEEVEQ